MSEIGSITKVFTGLLFAQAVKKGDLSLDDSLGKLLAETVSFQFPATAYRRDGLTVCYWAHWMISPSTQEAVIAFARNSHAPTSRIQNLLLAGLYPVTSQPGNTSLIAAD